jgi:serine/threonine protein kinase HipA of HipAB toxin-antitoxin module
VGTAAVLPRTDSDLRRLFEYVAFTVMVRNGDGHLKNFGLLYEHPGERRSVRTDAAAWS